jgi:hypothetical protein
MDSNRVISTAFIASMLLIAVGGASAQTIYKQVDEEGRVIFTDQPAPGARTITSYDTSRARAPAPVENGEWANRAEASRRPLPRIVEPAASENPVRDTANLPAPLEPQPVRPMAPDPGKRVLAETPVASSATTQNAASRTGSEGVPRKPAEVAAATQYPVAPIARSNFGEAERAVATYTALNTTMAAQADALEAARRARQEATKNTNGGAVLVVQAAPREQEPAAKKTGLDSFYLLWAATFFALAAGLLYVGWQVIRLILGTAFPRWQVGLG